MHEPRRQDILDAIWSIVEESGAAQVTVESVAGKTGRDPQDIVTQFSDQADLLRTAVAQVVSRARPMSIAPICCRRLWTA